MVAFKYANAQKNIVLLENRIIEILKITKQVNPALHMIIKKFVFN